MEIITCHLMEKHSLFEKLNIDPKKFHNFINAIEAGYSDVPYHNATHGIDVCQTAYYFTISCGLKDVADMKEIDIASMIVGTSIHDFEHFGFNNAFLIETQHEWAVRYNDRSVCESHHVAAAFNLLKIEEQNFFKYCKPDDFKGMRKRIVEMVLKTDMAKHFEDINKLQALTSDPQFMAAERSEEDRIFLVSASVHMADLSNPTKTWLVSLKWGILVYEEFFLQGDTEKDLGLPVGNLNDRMTVNIAKAQLGFFNFIIQPAFEVFKSLLPEVEANLKQLLENKARYEELVPVHQELMERGYDIDSMIREIDNQI